MTTARLREVSAHASLNAKAALTCMGCGHAGDFEGTPTVKEAMIQIEAFNRAHSGCQEKS